MTFLIIHVTVASIDIALQRNRARASPIPEPVILKVAQSLEGPHPCSCLHSRLPHPGSKRERNSRVVDSSTTSAPVPAVAMADENCRTLLRAKGRLLPLTRGAEGTWKGHHG